MMHNCAIYKERPHSNHSYAIFAIKPNYMLYAHVSRHIRKDNNVRDFGVGKEVISKRHSQKSVTKTHKLKKEFLKSRLYSLELIFKYPLRMC